MPAPSAYTDETQLATYMLGQLGETATILGWSGLAHVQEAVNEALLAYGADTITDATDMAKIRALAKREGWRLAIQSIAARFTFETDGQVFRRSDLMKAAQAALELAESQAAVFTQENAPSVEIDRVRYVNDPYGPYPDDLKVVP